MFVAHPHSRFITLITLSLIAASAFGISLTEYTFPTSRSQEAYVIGNANAGGTSRDSTQTAYSINGRSYYNFFYRSLPFTYKLNLDGSIATARPQTPDNAKEQSTYNFDLATSANRYLSNEAKWFGYGGFHTNFNKPSNLSHATKTLIDIEAGAGYGRTIDATVLKQAVRMSDDFKRFMITKADLPNDALLKLARIIDSEAEFRTQYGPVEYKKYWFNAMEAVVKESGMLVSDHLGAMGIIRIQEVFAEPTGLRLHGWEAKIGLLKVVQDHAGKAGNAKLQGSFDWSRPLDITLQLNNSFYANTVLNPDSSGIYDIGNKFQVYYEYSNRMHWDNTLNIQQTVRPTKYGKSSNLSTFSSTFLFYVENELSYNAGFNFTRNDNGYKQITDWAITSGINYRLR